MTPNELPCRRKMEILRGLPYANDEFYASTVSDITFLLNLHRLKGIVFNSFHIFYAEMPFKLELDAQILQRTLNMLVYAWYCIN